MKKTVFLLSAALFAASVRAGAESLKYTASMGRFENAHSWTGRWNLAEAFETLLSDQLANGGRFIFAEAQEGKSPALVSLKGSVAHVDETRASKGGGFGFKGISFNPDAGSAEVTVSLSMADPASGIVKAARTFTGRSRKGGVPLGRGGSSWALLAEMGGLEKDLVGAALADAVNQAADFAEAQLSRMPWHASVAMVKADKLIVNRGEREGVYIGMQLDIGEMEELVDEDTGEILDSELNVLSTVEVVEVREKISYTTPFAGAKKGMGAYLSRMK